MSQLRRLWLLGSLGGIIACGQDVDPPWQLDHDRVIAVRATPPRVASGEGATLDALLGRVGGATYEAAPDTVEVVGPLSLASALSRNGAAFRVTAPDAAKLAAVRAELGLAQSAPVPLQLRVGFSAAGLSARKVVWLGERADNSTIDSALVAGAEALPRGELSVAAGVDVPLAVDFDATYNINWLTSCGTMHDFDLPRAYLRVEADDPKDGELALVVRDERGGVAWKVWAISAR